MSEKKPKRTDTVRSADLALMATTGKIDAVRAAWNDGKVTRSCLKQAISHVRNIGGEQHPSAAELEGFLTETRKQPSKTSGSVKVSAKFSIRFQSRKLAPASKYSVDDSDVKRIVLVLQE